MASIEDLLKKIKWKAESPSGPVGYQTRKYVALLDGKEIGYVMQRESPSGGGSKRHFVVYHRGKQRDSTTSLTNAKRAMAKQEFYNGKKSLSLSATEAGRRAARRAKSKSLRLSVDPLDLEVGNRVIVELGPPRQGRFVGTIKKVKKLGSGWVLSIGSSDVYVDQKDTVMLA